MLQANTTKLQNNVEFIIQIFLREPLYERIVGRQQDLCKKLMIGCTLLRAQHFYLVISICQRIPYFTLFNRVTKFMYFFLAGQFLNL